MSKNTNDSNGDCQGLRAALYTRVSAQDEGVMTAAEQMKEVKRFAAQAGYDVVREYMDGGEAEPDAGAA